MEQEERRKEVVPALQDSMFQDMNQNILCSSNCEINCIVDQALNTIMCVS